MNTDPIAVLAAVLFVALVLVASLAENSAPKPQPLRPQRIAEFSDDPIERMWPKALKPQRALAARRVHVEMEVARAQVRRRIPAYAVMGQPREWAA